MSGIDCVIFDIGNVLVRWDPRNLYRRMGYSDAETAAIMAETGLPEVNHRQLDAGKPYREALARLAHGFPQHRDFLFAFDDRWTEMLGGAVEANVAVLRDLKQAGIAVHAISNFSNEKFALTRTLFPFLDDFDERIISAEVGMVKPDPEIFELLIERRSLVPARAVFIDDSAANITTAGWLGLQTIHVASEEISIRAELARLGLAI
jgi:2-haloacid dehalogenase